MEEMQTNTIIDNANHYDDYIASVRTDYAFNNWYPYDWCCEKQGTLGLICVKGSLRTELEYGVYGKQSYHSLIRAIAVALEDSEIEKIVITFNSPGGTVNGLFKAGRFLLDARNEKPILAIVEGESCSASYLLSCCCSHIVAEPYSLVGCCGVQVCTYNFDEYYKQAGILKKIFHSSHAKNKNLNPLTKEGEQALQERLDYYESAYYDLIAEGRGLDKDSCIENFGQGAVIAAEEALALGMIDEIKTADEAITEFESNTSSESSSESEGENMEQNKASLNEQEIRESALTAERKRVSDLMALRIPETAAVIDAAISAGDSVEKVNEKLVATLMAKVAELQANTGLAPVIAQSEAQEEVKGLPPQSEIDERMAKADTMADAINKELEVK